jgi:hypothetical protein
MFKIQKFIKIFAGLGRLFLTNVSVCITKAKEVLKCSFHHTDDYNGGSVQWNLNAMGKCLCPQEKNMMSPNP